MKKSVFTILNYLLPAKRVMPMHCSANVGADGDIGDLLRPFRHRQDHAVGRSPRTLIGDDEHGWSENGIFNFEGGCYAKVIKLSARPSREIFATTERFGTVLENVVMDPATRAARSRRRQS